jgi:hypothetical protein
LVLVAMVQQIELLKEVMGLILFLAQLHQPAVAVVALIKLQVELAVALVVEQVVALQTQEDLELTIKDMLAAHLLLPAQITAAAVAAVQMRLVLLVQVQLVATEEMGFHRL